MQRRMLLIIILSIAAGLIAGCQNQKQTAQAAEPIPAASTATVPPPEPYIPPPAPEPPVVVREPAVIASPAPARARTYTVQKGDTLIGIARRFYGSPAKYKDIAAANNLADPNRIRVGQVLILP